jgi:hypothetical protein
MFKYYPSTKLILNEEGNLAIEGAQRYFSIVNGKIYGSYYKFLGYSSGTTLKDILDTEGKEDNWKDIPEDFRPTKPVIGEILLSPQDINLVKNSVLTSNVGLLIGDVKSLFVNNQLITMQDYSYESKTSWLDEINFITKQLTVFF